MTRYHISRKVCHTAILAWAHFEATWIVGFEYTFCLWGGFLLLLFLTGKKQLSYSISLKLHSFPPQTFSPGPTFSSKRHIFYHLKTGYFPQPPIPASDQKWAELVNAGRRAAQCWEHKALQSTWALGSSEDTDMSSGLWNCPLQLILNLL